MKKIRGGALAHSDLLPPPLCGGWRVSDRPLPVHHCVVRRLVVFVSREGVPCKP